MKVKPVRKAVSSPIPTAAEAAADPSLVAFASPPRARRGMGAMVGAGLFGSLLAPLAACSGHESDVPAATPTTARAVSDPSDAEVAARAEAEREAVATVVAPMLRKALDEEGRGAFGCVAVDPPVVLSEADALELIRQEFAKAGVELVGEREIPGFLRTVPDKSKAPRPDKARPWVDGVYLAETVPGNWTFDLATADGSIAVEYLSLWDEWRESFEVNHSTVSDPDLPALAQRLHADFSTRTNGAPVTIGLFFDPLVRGKTLSGEEAAPLDWPQRRELFRQGALELLREQVRHFLDWAREEGRLP